MTESQKNMSEAASPTQPAPTSQRRTTDSPEYKLVTRFLWIFAALLVLGLIIPASVLTGQYDATAEEVINFRKEILSLMIAAFGASVGAGAAFFFGRENLREAYKGMKDLGVQVSPASVTGAPSERDNNTNGNKKDPTAPDANGNGSRPSDDGSSKASG